MSIRRKVTGRGGAKTALFGYCGGCRAMLQGNQYQDQLEAALSEPEKALDSPSVADLGDFDPVEISQPVEDESSTTTEPQLGKRRGGGVLKVVGIAAALGLTLLGVGRLAGQ